MKLYIVVREDLSPGQQAVQALHAQREFTARHPEEDLRWYSKSNTLVLLSVPDEPRLLQLLDSALERGYPVAPFREPDRSDELTALALAPVGKRLCRNLPKAFSNAER